jgi:hypothetical protein
MYVKLLHFSHFHHVLLVQWTNRLLPATGGSSLRPRGAAYTLELGLPVSSVSLQCGDLDMIPDHQLQ